MANLPDNIVAGDFTFTNVGQVAELGQATGNVATMQAYLDARGLDLMGWLNEILTSLKSTDGTANIARTDDGYGATAEAALTAIIAAGSGTIPPDDSISTAKIIDEAVTEDKLADDSVGADNIINEAVTEDKLANDSVGADNIIDDAVGADAIADNSITNAMMQDDSVDTAEIVNGAVTIDKLDSDVQDALNIIDITEQTGTTYTTILGDAGTLIEMNNGSAITVTIPPNSSVAYDVGAWIALYQKGAGQVTISPGSGVTINAPNSSNKIATQYGRCVLIKQATDTWSLGGWITA